MNNGFELIQHKDAVLHVNVDKNNRFFFHPCFKVSAFIERLRTEIFVNSLSKEEQESLLGDGVTCELLRPDAKGWQKGKVRIRLEFCPDVPESPLDDFRHSINESGS